MSDGRPRGILSSSDRAYLTGKTEFTSDQSEYDVRYRIRERIRNALLDFDLLFDTLAEQDRKQIFSPDAEEKKEFTEGVVSAVAFLYLGTEGYDPSRESLFGEGIRRAAQRELDDESAFCSVRIDVEHPSETQLQHIIECVESGAYHELGRDELRTLACFMHRRDQQDSDVLQRMKDAVENDRE